MLDRVLNRYSLHSLLMCLPGGRRGLTRDRLIRQKRLVISASCTGHDTVFCLSCACREGPNLSIYLSISDLVKFCWARSDLDQTGDSVLSVSTTFTTWQLASQAQPSQVSNPPASSPQPARGNKHRV